MRPHIELPVTHMFYTLKGSHPLFTIVTSHFTDPGRMIARFKFESAASETSALSFDLKLPGVPGTISHLHFIQTYMLLVPPYRSPCHFVFNFIFFNGTELLYYSIAYVYIHSKQNRNTHIYCYYLYIDTFRVSSCLVNEELIKRGRPSSESGSQFMRFGK